VEEMVSEFGGDRPQVIKEKTSPINYLAVL